MGTVDAVTGAVRSLRNTLGDTQQKFAIRMKTAERTIARWETTRPPRGKTLAQFYRLALANDLKELAEVFRRALTMELLDPDVDNTLAPIAFVKLRELRKIVISMSPGKKRDVAVAAIDELLQLHEASNSLAVFEAFSVDQKEAK